jgi:RNA:NAD 2'-phosphotransferase (TPT1/KptA family)
MKRTIDRQAVSRLPKPVIDRIRRYAQEGREPRARYGHDGCFLLAVTNTQAPVVILRSTRQEFPEIRSAALVEWMRAAQVKSAWRRAR